MGIITSTDLELQKNSLVKHNEAKIQKVVEKTIEEWNLAIQNEFIHKQSKILWLQLYVTNTEKLSALLMEEVYAKLTSELENSGLIFKRINEEDDFFVKNPFMDRLTYCEKYNNVW